MTLPDTNPSNADTIRDRLLVLETKFSALPDKIDKLGDAVANIGNKEAESKPKAGILTSNFLTFAVMAGCATFLQYHNMLTPTWAAIVGSGGLGYMGFRNKQISDSNTKTNPNGQ